MKIVLKNSTMVFEVGKNMVLLQPSTTLTGKALAYGRENFSFIITSSDNKSVNIYDLESLGVKAGDILHVKCVYNYDTSSIGASFFSEVLNGTEDSYAVKKFNIEGYNKFEGIGQSEDIYINMRILDKSIVVPEGAKCLVIGYKNTNPNVYFGTVHKIV